MLKGGSIYPCYNFYIEYREPITGNSLPELLVIFDRVPSVDEGPSSVGDAPTS